MFFKRRITVHDEVKEVAHLIYQIIRNLYLSGADMKVVRSMIELTFDECKIHHSHFLEVLDEVVVLSMTFQNEGVNTIVSQCLCLEKGKTVQEGLEEFRRYQDHLRKMDEGNHNKRWDDHAKKTFKIS